MNSRSADASAAPGRQPATPRVRAATGEAPLDEPVAATLRLADPLPAEPVLRGELARALPRTRHALAALAGTTRTHRAALAGGARTGRPAPAAGGPVAAYAIYPAPWGPVHIAVDDGGLVAIELRSTTERFVEDLARRLRGVPVPDQPGLPSAWREVLARTRQELDEYFAGRRRAFDLPVDLRLVSDWDRRVLGAARDLGFGQVTSYGGLARAIGRPRAARAVGGALGRNPIPLVIPCHRIVAGDGSLGGYGGGGHGSQASMLAVKRALLELEGVSLPAHLGR